MSGERVRVRAALSTEKSLFHGNAAVGWVCADGALTAGKGRAAGTSASCRLLLV